MNKLMVGTHGGLLFEYNALVNAVPEFWKTTMDDNSLVAIFPQEIDTEIGPLSNLSNKMIIKKPHDICAAKVGKQQMKVNRLLIILA